MSRPSPAAFGGSVPVRPARSPGAASHLRVADPEGNGQTVAQQLVARRLVKSYRKGKITIPVLRGVDFSIARGGFTAIVGQSGSGKSTLLHLLATLDSPDQGEVHFEGTRIDNLPPLQRDRLRNRNLGMIFQFYHLLPELTTLENVLTPIMIAEGIWSYWRRKRSYAARPATARHGRTHASAEP